MMTVRTSSTLKDIACFVFTCSILLLQTGEAWSLYPNWTSDGDSVHIEGIPHENPDNRLIYDNDIYDDMIDFALPWAKQSLGECNLVGIIASSNPHEHNCDAQFTLNQCMVLYNAAINSGWQNLPVPVKGRACQMNSTTDYEWSEGVELIYQQSLLSTPQKPLLVVCGGQVSTPATAYLHGLRQNPPVDISDRMIVFHVDPNGYNGRDGHARTVCEQNLLYVTHPGNIWWPQPAKGDPPMITQAMVDSLEVNAINQFIRDWKSSYNGQQYADLADGGPACWWFGQHTWNSMVEQNGQLKMQSMDAYQQADVWYATVGRHDIDEPPIEKPTNVLPTAVSSDMVQIVWTDNSDNEDGFKIERKPWGGEDVFHEVGSTGVNQTSFTDTDGLYGSVVYTYRVGAYKD